MPRGQRGASLCRSVGQVTVGSISQRRWGLISVVLALPSRSSADPSVPVWRARGSLIACCDSSCYLPGLDHVVTVRVTVL